jgi:hypothetical protein
MGIVTLACVANGNNAAFMAIVNGLFITTIQENGKTREGKISIIAKLFNCCARQ